MRICPALRKAKITDPNSKAGIVFCTQSCPYPDCIAVETDYHFKRKRAGEISWIKRLYEKGMTTEDIAGRMSKSVGTVKKYLK